MEKGNSQHDENNFLKKNENCVQLQKGLAARAKTDACRDNKNKIFDF